MQLSSKYIISIALSAQILLPFSRDPKKGSYGSSSPSAQRYIPSAQYVAPHTVAMALYVVLYLWAVMRRAGAENSDMMIFSAWYTSGKSFI
ncbi:hypothetical protein ACPSMC_005030 [Escherichia coli]